MESTKGHVVQPEVHFFVKYEPNLETEDASGRQNKTQRV